MGIVVGAESRRKLPDLKERRVKTLVFPWRRANEFLACQLTCLGYRFG